MDSAVGPATGGPDITPTNPYIGADGDFARVRPKEPDTEACYNPGMRILMTADLHFDIPRSREPACRLARRVCQCGGDVLVLLGDTAGADLGPLREGLAMFDDFSGVKLLVPGNHCLWCRPGETSLQRYHDILPAEAARAGFVLLDHCPQVLNGVGMVGSVGWYDYSLANASLGIPEPFYEAKLSPGAAAYVGQDELVDAHRASLTDRHLSLGVRWMDGRHVKLGMTDKAFVDTLAERLAAQLAEISQRVDQIVVFMHHLPLAEQVPRGRPDRLAFTAAFMGSQRFGQILLADEKVSHVYSGHSHWPDRRTVGRLTAVNVGSTYVEKQLEVLDL